MTSNDRTSQLHESCIKILAFIKNYSSDETVVPHQGTQMVTVIVSGWVLIEYIIGLEWHYRFGIKY